MPTAPEIPPGTRHQAAQLLPAQIGRVRRQVADDRGPHDGAGPAERGGRGQHERHGEPRIVEPEKCADLRWFALAALPDPVVPHEHAVLAALASGQVPPVISFGF